MKSLNNPFFKILTITALFYCQVSLSKPIIASGKNAVSTVQKKSASKSKKQQKKAVKAGDIIEIDQHSGISNARISPNDTGQSSGNQVDYIKNGGWLRYNNVDFGKGKLEIMKAMVSSGSQGGILEIRLDSQTGPILTTIKVPNTGGWKSWKLVSAPITGKAKGVKDIYCLFKGDGNYLYNLNWLRFSSKSVRSSKKPHPLEKGLSVVSSGNTSSQNTSSQSASEETPAERGRRLRDVAKGKKIGIPLGQIIAIKSGKGKFLSVQGETIKATEDTIGDNERFVALSEGGNVVAIKSMATNKLFSARLNRDGIPVIASHSGDAKDWEKFTWQKIGDIQFTLKAHNGNLVEVDDNNQNKLTADKGSKLSIKGIFIFEIIK